MCGFYLSITVIGIIRRKAMIKDLAAIYHAECLAYCQELLELQKKAEEVSNIVLQLLCSFYFEEGPCFHLSCEIHASRNNWNLLFWQSIYLIRLISTVNLSCVDSSFSMPLPGQILKKCTSFEESNTHLLTFLKNPNGMDE